MDKAIGEVPWGYSPIILEEEINNFIKDGAKAMDSSSEAAYLAAKYSLKLTGLVDLDASVKMYEAREDILYDGGIPSYENVLKVMNAPKALNGESSSRKSRKRKVFY